MILSDRDIAERIASGDLMIGPLERFQLQPASIDLRLAANFQVFRGSKFHVVDPTHPESFQGLTETIWLADHTSALINPGEFMLGSTVETVWMPDDLVGRLEGRSSLGRLGIIIHSTAGFIDPGFRGTLTLEISNLGHHPVRLPVGMRVCQITFEQLSTPAKTPYRSQRNKYQGQMMTAPSLLHLDPEFRKDWKREPDDPFKPRDPGAA